MGAGVMRAIPVEKAIPADTENATLDRVSYYIERNQQHIALLPCQCRRVRRYMNEGAGDLEGAADYETGMCMFLGMGADMFVAEGRAYKITKEEAYAKLKYFEEIGCVHQITTLNKGVSVAICNCMPGTCLALGASQYFNTPDASRSNFEAYVTAENCVACGQCVETCPNNALKLGQKVCSKTPIEHKLADLPRDTEWTKDKWNPDYRDNRENVVETGTAPCKTTCPAHIAVQGYIKKAAEGDYLGALDLIKKENPFPAICGRICPHNCENECTRGDIDQPVAIDEIKKFIADKELESGFQLIPKKYHNYGKSIAVIGSGPAGLSCAYYLAADGYKVTVFEKERVVGGMEIKGYDSYTYSHSLNVGILSILLANEMGITRNRLEDIGLCALMHDIGKVDIPIQIINKNGPVTDSEFAIIKTHPEKGVERLRKCFNVSHEVLQGVQSHHEKVDGTGYPYGYKGTRIPMFGRILAVSDVYDALTSQRSYRGAWLPNQAIEYIVAKSDSQFDRDLVGNFMHIVCAYPAGTVVQLSDDSPAVVVKNFSENVLRPQVRLLESTELGPKGAEINLFEDREYFHLTVKAVLGDANFELTPGVAKMAQ